MEEGAAILSIHISTTLSSVCNAARMAAEQFPGSQIAVVDSRQLSMGQGLQALELGRAAAGGCDLAEAVEMARQLTLKARTAAVLDDLEHVRRGGRISRIVSLIGTLLSMKPMFRVLDGEVCIMPSVRTRKRALRRLVEFIAGLGRPRVLAVMHAAQPQLAWEVKERLAGLYPDRPIWFTEAGAAVGTHVGPGAIGVSCLLE